MGPIGLHFANIRTSALAPGVPRSLTRTAQYLMTQVARGGTSLAGWALSVEGSAPVPFDFIDLFYVRADETEINEITSDRIAALKLADLSGRDTIIYADQLACHQVGPDGMVS